MRKHMDETDCCQQSRTAPPINVHAFGCRALEPDVEP
jgi:hypothetical protein